MKEILLVLNEGGLMGSNYRVFLKETKGLEEIGHFYPEDGYNAERLGKVVGIEEVRQPLPPWLRTR